jgi:hypothetical protein
MHVPPFNSCPTSFAALVHNKERFYVKHRNLSLLRSEHCVRESSTDRSVTRVTTRGSRKNCLIRNTVETNPSPKNCMVVGFAI